MQTESLQDGANRSLQLVVESMSCILERIIQKTYQFINVVNGVSRSYKTANIFLFDSVL